jgi:lysyl-tRNA synthetase class II
MKQTKRIELTYLSFYDLEGDLEDVIQTLKDLKTQYVIPENKDVSLSVQQTSSYSTREHLVLYGSRPETDEEEKVRVDNENKLRDYRLQEYLRLKKEFGNGA